MNVGCKREEYWREREDHVYLFVVRKLVNALGKDARSILDVGSNGCPYLNWFDWIERRTSVDLRVPYRAPGVDAIAADFLQWHPERHHDIILCLQVLEHVPDAEAFARKLLASGKSVVVSVPYKWRAGGTLDHIHDPVDENKMRLWFGREPNYAYVAKEVDSHVSRLICVYESDHLPSWRSLEQREKQNLSRTTPGTTTGVKITSIQENERLQRELFVLRTKQKELERELAAEQSKFLPRVWRKTLSINGIQRLMGL